MILDTLRHGGKYTVLHPGLAAGFKFLARSDLAELECGRHDIDGDRLYAMIVKGDGKGQAAARLEAHRRYIDVQYTIVGEDVIGWKDVADCRADSDGFDGEADLELFRGSPAAWIRVEAGSFAVFFVEDVHAPMAATGAIHKAVVKIAVD